MRNYIRLQHSPLKLWVCAVDGPGWARDALSSKLPSASWFFYQTSCACLKAAPHDDWMNLLLLTWLSSSAPQLANNKHRDRELHRCYSMHHAFVADIPYPGNPYIALSGSLTFDRHCALGTLTWPPWPFSRTALRTLSSLHRNILIQRSVVCHPARCQRFRRFHRDR